MASKRVNRKIRVRYELGGVPKQVLFTAETARVVFSFGPDDSDAICVRFHTDDPKLLVIDSWSGDLVIEPRLAGTVSIGRKVGKK